MEEMCESAEQRNWKGVGEKSYDTSASHHVDDLSGANLIYYLLCALERKPTATTNLIKFFLADCRSAECEIAVFLMVFFGSGSVFVVKSQYRQHCWFECVCFNECFSQLIHFFVDELFTQHFPLTRACNPCYTQRIQEESHSKPVTLADLLSISSKKA